MPATAIQRIAFDIETTVDRRDFGIEWNMRPSERRARARRTT